MGMFSIDGREARGFALELRSATEDVVREVPRVVERGALNMKKQLVSEANLSRHFKIASSISYDLHDGGFEAEIGPVKHGAGNLANIAYFGGANGGGGTLPEPGGALRKEAPKCEREIGKLLKEMI